MTVLTQTVLSSSEKRAVWFRSYSLPVRDRAGRKWEFVIKSWANGTENRRVYVLEQTGEYLKVLLLCIMLHDVHVRRHM